MDVSDSGSGSVFASKRLRITSETSAAVRLTRVFETGLDFGELIGLRLLNIPENAREVCLRGDKDPGASVAHRREGFRDRLKIQHELRVLTNELAYLINEEIEPEVVGLPVDVFLDLFGEGLDVEAVSLT